MCFFSHLPCRLSKCVGLELLASVVWKWGCQPFSCRCLQNVTQCQTRFVGHVGFQESIPAIPFGNSQHPIPARSFRFLRATAHSTSSALCLLYACKRSHPFVSCAEKHRFGHGGDQGLLRNIGMCRLSKCVGIELLASVVWKWGCQPFSCRCLQNVTQCQTRFVGHVCFQESIPAIPFGNSQHPIPARSFRFLRATAHSISSALCLLYACKRSHPFVEDSGFVSYAESIGLVTEETKVCYGILECVDYRNVSALSF